MSPDYEISVSNTYEYPARARRIVRGVSLLVLGFNVAEYLLAMLGVAYRALIMLAPDRAPAEIPFIRPVLEYYLASTLLTAHLGLLVALVVARTIAYLTPSVTLSPDGLRMRTWAGSRFIPYKSIRGVHSVAMADERFLVWVETRNGLPLQNLLALLLLGRWSWSGFLLTSDLENFDDIAGLVFGALQQNYGEEQWAPHYSEGQPNAQLEMLTRPLKVCAEAGRVEPIPLSMRDAALQMISASCSLALPLIVASLIHLQIPWGALAVALMSLLEWPFAAAFMFAISDTYTRRINFDEALRLYPLTQLSRWGIALGLTVLVAMGWPWLLYAPLLLPAVAFSSVTVLKLVEGLFDLSFPSSLVGVVVTVIYQAIVYGLFLTVLPR